MDEANYTTIKGALGYCLVLAKQEGDLEAVRKLSEAIKCLEWLAERGRSN